MRSTRKDIQRQRRTFSSCLLGCFDPEEGDTQDAKYSAEYIVGRVLPYSLEHVQELFDLVSAQPTPTGNTKFELAPHEDKSVRAAGVSTWACAGDDRKGFL